MQMTSGIGRNGFKDRVSRKWGRDVDDGYISTVVFNRFGYRVADRHFAFPQLTTFTGSDAGDDVGAVFEALKCVKGAGLSGQTLDD